jgi:hypothetical protein
MGEGVIDALKLHERIGGTVTGRGRDGCRLLARSASGHGGCAVDARGGVVAST